LVFFESNVEDLLLQTFYCHHYYTNHAVVSRLSVVVFYKDGGTMETVSASSFWSAQHRVSTWSDGTQIHHRSDVQRLHLNFWIWRLCAVRAVCIAHH